MNTDRPTMTNDHYLDALAMCRATLNNDETGLMALVNTMNVGMTFQALVHLHLGLLDTLVGGNPRAIDDFLGRSLESLKTMEPPC